MIILNLKNYPESVGENTNKLLKSLAETQANNPKAKEVFYIAPNTLSLSAAKATFPDLNVIAPHVDKSSLGSTTGWVSIELLKAFGIEMSVVNHSEHRFQDFAVLKDLIAESNEKSFNLVVCCESLQEAEELLEVKPYAIAFEDKELIGSGKSITSGRPDDVKAFIELTTGKTHAVIGAGVSTGEDIKEGLSLGARGFILASAFVKAEDPAAKLKEFLDAYNS